MGIPANRVMYESASTNTYQNAVLSAAMPGVNPARPWLLLTSAFTQSSFRQAGWGLTTAYPVDYRAGRATPWTEYSLQRGAERWHLGLHEWIGLLYQYAWDRPTNMTR